MRLFLLVSIGGLFFGCATAPRITSTPSGKPEVEISGVSLDQVNNALITAMTGRGFLLEEQSTNSLFFTHEMSGGSAIGAQLLIGNSYSTTPKEEVRYVSATSSSGVRVIAHPSMSTQMALGQIRRHDMSQNNNWFNGIQSMLQAIKYQLESSITGQQPVSVSTTEVASTAVQAPGVAQATNAAPSAAPSAVPPATPTAAPPAAPPSAVPPAAPSVAPVAYSAPLTGWWDGYGQYDSPQYVFGAKFYLEEVSGAIHLYGVSKKSSGWKKARDFLPGDLRHEQGKMIGNVSLTGKQKVTYRYDMTILSDGSQMRGTIDSGLGHYNIWWIRSAPDRQVSLPPSDPAK